MPDATTGKEPTPRADAAQTPTYIVGIGASAGGLSAIEVFFDNMPADTGMAFVVVQHLSPDFKSLMDDLLARHTSMRIIRVTDGLALRANVVYLIPAKTHMTVVEGKLYLTEKIVGMHVELPIDIFFNSLAEDAGDRAIAVILSGTGSDGSRGIQAIHKRGGFVVVQSPDSAQFDGMPRNAIATGIPNFILSPERIPRILQEYAVSPVAVRSRMNHQIDAFEDDGEYAEVFALLRRTYRLDFSKYKRSTVGRRIRRRMEFRKIPEIGDYAAIVSGDSAELDQLYKDLLIGVTEFFRDRDAFAALEREILPRLFSAAQDGRDIRIWSAACATGEEPYSVAILCAEQAQAAGYEGKITVFATDVHKASLEAASQGLYERDRLRNVSPERLERFFKKESADYFRVTSELRKLIVFAPHDMLTDPPFTRLDVVCCRNVLIYLQPPVQEKLISLFHFSLKVGGTLFLGSSEGVGAFASEFEALSASHKLFRKVRDLKLALNLEATRLEAPVRAAVVPPGQASRGRMVSIDRQILQDYDRLLSRHMPSGVLLAADRTILHYFGGAAEYLKDPRGRPESNILNLVEDNLHVALSASLPRVERTNESVVTRNLLVSRRGEQVRIDLGVSPLFDDRTRTMHFFVGFEAARPRPAPVAGPPQEAQEGDFDLRANYRQHVQNLETELQAARESLQNTVEELQTSNEELQATNQELLAANEELQSTNEELHSVNEELYSVNSEFERKNVELKQLNTDHDNLLNSIDIGTIFLDRHLRIRKFNPAIAAFFKLLPQDVGRPIDHIAYQLSSQERLLEDIAAVLATGTPVAREERTRDDHWLLNEIMAFRTENGQIEGVVVTFTDISRLKETELRLIELNDELELRVDQRTRELQHEIHERHAAEARVAALRDHYLSILMKAPALIWRSNVSGACDWFNDTWLKFTGRALDEELGDGWTLGVHPGDLDRCLAIYRESFARREPFEMEYRLRRSDGDFRWINDIGCPIFGVEGDFAGYIGYCFDITERMRAEQQLKSLNEHLESRVQARTRDLEEANRNLENVCYSISHELRAPVARLEGFGDQLLESVRPIQAPDVSHYAERIVYSSRKLKTVIDSVLLLNRLSRREMRRERVDMSALCAGMVEELKEEFNREASTSIQDGVVVEGDRDMLEICMRNLLANAFKYSANTPQAKVTFHVQQGDAGRVYVVSDNGAGFNMVYADKLFRPFSRLHQESEFQGLGIGLAMAQQVALRHGGRIWAESAAGDGARFYFTLGEGA